MWAKVESDSVTKVYTRPTAITVGDINYPQNIFNLWSEAELNAVGIYSVTIDSTNIKSSRYYNNTDVTYTFDSDNETVTGAYGTAVAQDLATLKDIKKVEINNTAAGGLSDYDWYTLRAASGGTAIPSAITTYQAAVRTKANTHCTSIDAAANVDALAALTFDWPDEPS